MSEPTHFESLYPDTTRFEEIQKLLAFVKEGNSSQLIGMAGVGKANVLRLLTYNKAIRLKHLGENQKWFHFVMVDFSEMRRRPLFEITKFLFLNLADSLRERGMKADYEEINQMLHESIAASDELILFQGLKRAIDYLSIQKELTVVFLFDRFEEYVPKVEDDFFANLRVLRNRAKYRFSAIFALNRPLEDLLENSILSDFYEFVAGHYVYMPIADTPGTEFRLSYLEKVTGKKLPAGVKEQILLLTGGHVRLIRLCAEGYFAQESFQSGSAEELMSYFLSQKTIENALKDIWEGLLPAEQTFLIGDTFPDSPEKEYLTRIGLLDEDKIDIPLFTEYLTRFAKEEKKKEKIIYDTATNEIRKGDDILSEILTSSEFLLLAYLLEHEGRIIQRDEIIQAVWKDEKTTEGVTDQAVDQLVFRLRKKIEDNPNTPSHIQTIKGRGIKFSP